MRLGAALLLALGVGAWQRERARRLAAQLARAEEALAFRQVFGRFVTPEVAEEALSGRLGRAGQCREVTVLMADLRGFTPMTEALPPEELVRLLNAWLTRMVEAIEAEGGTVDKFVGDAVMAIFNAPRTQPDHADRALRAARAMVRATRALAEEARARHGVALGAGVGIASGEAIVGPVGSDARMEYTAIGEPVNLAARVEALTRKLDADVLLAESTRARLRDPAGLEPAGAHRLKGIAEPVAVWAWRADDPPAA